MRLITNLECGSLDLETILGSSIRRKQMWCIDNEIKAAHIMETNLKVEGVETSTRYLTVLLCLGRPSVLLPAAVALLGN